ncbi:MAG TPA: hypothetical protein VFJ96_06835 [Gemmatimonadaceae bacterium]|nr:hypothetical protein [Gemmatimonadaceae bacterium]
MRPPSDVTAMRRMRMSSIAMLIALAPAFAAAQGDTASLDAQLAARLDASTRSALAPVLDSARIDGLPTRPLIEKALEGASKRATGARIVAAVHALRVDLGAARAALGSTSSEQEIVAGASALRAGVTSTTLGQLRADRPGEPLTVPLGVLADLIARGVPVDTAAAVVASLERSGAPDGDFVALRGNVERDVRAGALPAVAASVRGHGVPGLLGVPPGRATGMTAASPDAKRPKKP